MDGRVAKIFKERALLEQPFIKDTTKTVGEHIKATVAAIGENIQVRLLQLCLLCSFWGNHAASSSLSSQLVSGLLDPSLMQETSQHQTVTVHIMLLLMRPPLLQVRRFARYVLGEGIQKRESNLAAEVAAATGQT